ncbi:hypothetical protein ACFE04_013595 [Oxalis oulophora]
MGVTKTWLHLHLLCIVFLFFISNVNGDGKGNGNGVEKKQEVVSYDSRSLIINGKRELLFSGSIHYTRSTPDQWPDILTKAKRGGLNVIQTYVFWNAHEPEQGKFNFEGQYDLVKYIKLIKKHGMYVTLRLGPFIQAEWNHGGLPYWLREVPDIIFRSDNEPFKRYMQKYVEMIIDMMKKEKLFAPQGGPIILAQIENEYNTVQLAYRELGNSYVQWAAKLALSQNAGVPWIMCKQRDAPDPVVGINGEKAKIYTMEGTNTVQWALKSKAPTPALSWFKASFAAPEGNDPVVVRMNGMKKGMVWINGQSIGRYWMSYLSPLGQPSQSEYHIPRSYIKPTKNLIVVFEEEPATSIENIEIMTVNRDTICSYITELYPPHVKSWARKESKINTVVDLVKPAAHLKCPDKKVVVAVEFASYGDEPDGACGMFGPPKCTSQAAKEVVEKFCIGKSSCVVPLDRQLYYKKSQDGCPDIKKALAIQVRCQNKA